ncbi:MAG TPA: hypothetical protein VMV69_05740 [Pirellulales bacterium]|nr:hypothetical protein [Pirellulales bacterium]
MKRTIIAALLVTLMGLGSGCCSCRQHGLCGKLRCRQGCREGCGDGCEQGCRHRCGLFANRGCGIFGHRGCGGQCGPGGQGGYDDGAAYGGGGPPSAQVTYPYYTTRGPRDFLSDNPRGIGP